DAASIFYTLTQPAQVTATLVDSTGATVSMLFTDFKAAGQQSFRFAANQIPDGPYTIALGAVSAARQTVSAVVPVTGDRGLRGFGPAPELFSLGQPPLTATFTLAQPAHTTFNLLDE